MVAKSDRLEARVSREQRKTLERAANLAGTSLSAFVIDAAMERAQDLVAAQLTTTVPADFFDRVIGAIDRADSAPGLANAARRAERRPRIANR